MLKININISPSIGGVSFLALGTRSESSLQTMGVDCIDYLPKENEDVIKSKKGTYEVLEAISKSTSKSVYHVMKLENKKHFAMKCEFVKEKNPTLRHEARVLESLKDFLSPHFLTLEDRGMADERFVFIMIKLVGKNLMDLRQELPDKKFSMATGIRVAEQTLAGIRDLHTCGYIHRNIKPHNFAVGREEDDNFHTIFILDFKFARKFKTEGKDLRLKREQTGFRGTPRYASIAALSMLLTIPLRNLRRQDYERSLQKEQSRRDDLEAWWYMIVELMLGQLPWHSLQPNQLEEIKQVKKRIRQKPYLKILLKNKNTPQEYMTNILRYIDTLQYDSIPDYDHIAAHLDAAMRAYYIKNDSPPDWDLMTRYKGPKYMKRIISNMEQKAQ